MYKIDMGILLLCLFIFVLLVVVLSALLIRIFTLSKQSIEAGLSDVKIIDDYNRYKNIRSNVFLKVIFNIFADLIYLLLIVLLSISMYSIFTDGTTVNHTTMKTVESNSMSFKNDKNKYLFENGLDNQFNKNDLIMVSKLPDKQDLKLYDIVIYEKNDVLIVHRIVDIKIDANGVLTYVLQGDSNSSPDRYEVFYEQMRGIYTNKKIPYLGAFIRFFKSPPGIICFALILVVTILIRILDRMFYNIKVKRLIKIGYIEEPDYMTSLKYNNKNKVGRWYF